MNAGIGTQAIYLFALCAALLRIIASLVGSMLLMEFAGAAWVAAFGGFVLLYGPIPVATAAGLGRTRVNRLVTR